jgi:hypothetical protein
MVVFCLLHEIETHTEYGYHFTSLIVHIKPSHVSPVPTYIASRYLIVFAIVHLVLVRTTLIFAAVLGILLSLVVRAVVALVFAHRLVFVRSVVIAMLVRVLDSVALGLVVRTDRHTIVSLLRIVTDLLVVVLGVTLLVLHRVLLVVAFFLVASFWNLDFLVVVAALVLLVTT